MTNPLAAIQSALAISGTIPVDIVCMGDSLTEGMACPHREQAWPQRTRDILRAATMSESLRGGIGYCPSYSVSASLGDFWSKSSGVVTDVSLLTGLGQRMLKVPNGASVSLGFVGTGIDVLTTTGTNSAYTWSLDGGADTYVDARQSNGLASGVVGVSLRGLWEKSHTITFKGCSTGNAYVEGAMVYRDDETAGIHSWEAGHSGAKASDLNASAAWHGSFLSVPAKALVTLMLGTNEYQQGVSVSSFASSLQTLTATIKSLLPPSCAFLLMSAHRRVPLAGFPDWSLYEQAISSCAASNGCGYLAFSPVIGDPIAAQAAGLIESGGGTHPTDKGHALYAQALTDYVMSFSG